jgi:hypothetical protein
MGSNEGADLQFRSGWRFSFTRGLDDGVQLGTELRPFDLTGHVTFLVQRQPNFVDGRGLS